MDPRRQAQQRRIRKKHREGEIFRRYLAISLVCLGAATVILVGGLWWLTQPPSTPQQAPLSHQASLRTGAGKKPLLDEPPPNRPPAPGEIRPGEIPPGAPGGPPPRPPGGQPLKGKNLLVQGGWEAADSVPPDPGILTLNPELLGSLEPDLRRQLETTPISDELVENARVIVYEASEPRTRAAALDAMGRLDTDRARDALMEIVENHPGGEERGIALDFIRPRGLGDPSARWLVGQFQSDRLEDRQKKQIAFALALAGMMESQGDLSFLSKLGEQIPARWQKEIEKSAGILAAGGRFK